jgi:hypothetical protein
MRKLITIIVIILTTISCSKDNNNSETLLNGKYIGTFERGTNISNVEFTFNDGAYTGASDTVKFPAICDGTYTVTGRTIDFQSLCAWTAEFDWTLILGGEWNYTFQNNTLIMVHSNGDKYTLTRQ